MDDIMNTLIDEESLNMLPPEPFQEPIAPSESNVNNNLDLKKQLLSNNRKNKRKYKGKCPKLKIDKAYDKFGVHILIILCNIYTK